jgi:hypothetical protein
MIGEEKNFAPVNGKLLKLQQQKKQRVLVVQIKPDPTQPVLF